MNDYLKALLEKNGRPRRFRSALPKVMLLENRRVLTKPYSFNDFNIGNVILSPNARLKAKSHGDWHLLVGLIEKRHLSSSRDEFDRLVVQYEGRDIEHQTIRKVSFREAFRHVHVDLDFIADDEMKDALERDFTHFIYSNEDEYWAKLLEVPNEVAFNREMIDLFGYDLENGNKFSRGFTFQFRYIGVGWKFHDGHC